MQHSNTVSVALTNLSIPASKPNQGLIRVAASDGYYTGFATSAPFTVLNRTPKVYIISPAEGETVAGGTAVVLRGAASDAEDGNLNGYALQWTIGGQVSGTGKELLVNGLAPGDYPVTLTARDSISATATTQAILKILPLSIPAANPSQLDGVCDDEIYNSGVEVSLAPYNDGEQTNASLVRSTDYLWVCFSGLAHSNSSPGDFAGIRIDVNNSHDELAQNTDYGFFVGEDGGYFTKAGDGAGGFEAIGPSGLQAQVSASESTWSAELRIDASALESERHQFCQRRHNSLERYSPADHLHERFTTQRSGRCHSSCSGSRGGYHSGKSGLG